MPAAWARLPPWYCPAVVRWPEAVAPRPAAELLSHALCVVSRIGLFRGMFERNILTFSPFSDGNAQKLATFTDVHHLQRELMAQEVQSQQQADESTTGPVSFVVVDPGCHQRLRRWRTACRTAVSSNWGALRTLSEPREPVRGVDPDSGWRPLVPSSCQDAICILCCLLVESSTKQALP